MVAISLWHTDPATSALKSASLTQEPQDLILDATYSLVSLGTEKIVLTGMVPPELLHCDESALYGWIVFISSKIWLFPGRVIGRSR